MQDPNLSNTIDLRNLLSKMLEVMDNLQTQLNIEKEKTENLNNEFIIEKEKTENLINEFEIKYIRLSRRHNDLHNYTTSEINDLYDDLYMFDCRMIRIEQYSRRESLVISGIPDSVPQRELEPLVLDILRSVGVNAVSSYEVCACHRLAKKRGDKFSARTVIKFTNRKIVEYCIENRDILQKVKPRNMNLRFYQSLSDANEDVLYQCKQLMKYGLIENYFLRNGFIKIVRIDNNRPFKIIHPDILYKMFKDYYDHEDLYLLE